MTLALIRLFFNLIIGGGGVIVGIRLMSRESIAKMLLASYLLGSGLYNVATGFLFSITRFGLVPTGSVSLYYTIFNMIEVIPMLGILSYILGFWGQSAPDNLGLRPRKEK